jgi:16S rRNA C967 or C1407 C5-methylase (RsmB/RsmF family)
MPLLGRPVLPTIQVDGVTLAYNHPHDLAACIEVFVLNVYPRQLLRPGDFVLDSGSGVGEFTVLAARAVGPTGLVVSVESNPLDFQTLLRNVQTNGVRNVVAFNCAVGRDSSDVHLNFKGVT